MIEYAEAAAEQLREEGFSLEPSGKSMGRPQKPDSLDKVAERIGISSPDAPGCRPHSSMLQ